LTLYAHVHAVEVSCTIKADYFQENLT